MVPAGVVPGLAALAAFGLVGIAVYLAAALPVGVDEARVLVEQARSWAGRLRPAP
jgi:hypothetical protein